MNTAELVTSTAPTQIQTAMVYVVDDDVNTCQITTQLLRRQGFYATAFSSAGEFLEALVDDPYMPKCLVCDLRMPVMDGLQLQAALAKRNIRMPIVFVTAFGQVSLAVQAMKGGAVDFLLKPVRMEQLHALIAQVLEADLQRCERLLAQRNVGSRLDKLTPREREVCDLLAVGRSTKEIASQLKINAKTVFVHRARVLEKMHVDNLVALSSILREL